MAADLPTELLLTSSGTLTTKVETLEVLGVAVDGVASTDAMIAHRGNCADKL